MEAKEAREEEEEVTVAKAERVVVSVAEMAAAVVAQETVVVMEVVAMVEMVAIVAIAVEMVAGTVLNSEGKERLEEGKSNQNESRHKIQQVPHLPEGI